MDSPKKPSADASAASAPSQVPHSPVDRPLPGSQKDYLTGSRFDLRVPVRKVVLTPTSGRFGQRENPPVFLYDTSGPYTDPAVTIDVHEGLPRIRTPWIAARNDSAAPSPWLWSAST